MRLVSTATSSSARCSASSIRSATRSGSTSARPYSSSPRTTSIPSVRSATASSSSSVDLPAPPGPVTPACTRARPSSICRMSAAASSQPTVPGIRPPIDESGRLMAPTGAVRSDPGSGREPAPARAPGRAPGRVRDRARARAPVSGPAPGPEWDRARARARARATGRAAGIGRRLRIDDRVGRRRRRPTRDPAKRPTIRSSPERWTCRRCRRWRATADGTSWPAARRPPGDVPGSASSSMWKTGSACGAASGAAPVTYAPAGAPFGSPVVSAGSSSDFSWVPMASGVIGMSTARSAAATPASTVARSPIDMRWWAATAAPAPTGRRRMRPLRRPAAGRSRPDRRPARRRARGARAGVMRPRRRRG